MSTKPNVWLAAAWLILIVQISKAWELESCDLTKNIAFDLVRFNIKNCPDKTGEYCEVVKDSGFEFELIFKTSLAYEKARAKITFGDSIRFNGYLCDELNVSCPGAKGQLLGFDFFLGSITNYQPVNSEETFIIQITDGLYSPVLCVKFKIKVVAQQDHNNNDAVADEVDNELYNFGQHFI